MATGQRRAPGTSGSGSSFVSHRGIKARTTVLLTVRMYMFFVLFDIIGIINSE